MDRLNITKTSWGIVLLYDIHEVHSFDKDAINILEVHDNIFFKIEGTKIDNHDFKYLKLGMQSVLQFMNVDKPVCYFIDLEFNICHYQPEGMYYMFRKWFFENHDMEMPPINVYYDKEVNRYIFPDLTDELNTQ